MMSFRKKIVNLVMISAFFLVPTLAMAQIDPGCDPDDPLCPIDGGVSLLIAAGIGIGAKRVYDEKKKASVRQTEK
ncbi:MAG TPA: hypothetical protein PKC62_08830 [Ferruginibacter sp.]|jgi:hypothetical protein|nr:hypothetical protein [Ferruginibacter sp.]HMU24575.1 hypothetical protein [Ferruginibacter sp.]